MTQTFNSHSEIGCYLPIAVFIMKTFPKPHLTGGDFNMRVETLRKWLTTSQEGKCEGRTWKKGFDR